MPALGLFVLLLSPFVTRRVRMRRLRRAMTWYGRVLMYVLPRPWLWITYEDREPSRTRGGCVVVCNHRSSSDAFLMACLPFECVQVVNTWPFSLPILGPVARLAGYLSINEMPYDEFIARGAKLLEEGVCIIGFPEGTRSGATEMGPFHGAMFRLAREAEMPIIPLCISGNERAPARGVMWLEPGRVRLRKLRP